MAKQKQNQLSRADYALFAVGALSITFVAAFIANGLFKGRIELLLIEAVLYVAVVVMYVQAVRGSHGSLVQFTRVISYAGIITAVLITSFLAYFVTTYRW